VGYIGSFTLKSVPNIAKKENGCDKSFLAQSYNDDFDVGFILSALHKPFKNYGLV